eukprot:357826-Chlamydomonas_euryale.AAC.6
MSMVRDRDGAGGRPEAMASRAPFGGFRVRSAGHAPPHGILRMTVLPRPFMVWRLADAMSNLPTIKASTASRDGSACIPL